MGEKCLEKADFESDLQNSYQEQKKGRGSIFEDPIGEPHRNVARETVFMQ